MPRDYLLIAFGGALGSIARFVCSGLAARRWGEIFPFGTLLVNVTGSFIIGVFAALTVNPDALGRAGTDELRAFFMVGICGGFTTFSSLSLQTLALHADGKWRLAAINVLGSAALGLGSVALGYAVASLWSGGPGPFSY